MTTDIDEAALDRATRIVIPTALLTLVKVLGEINPYARSKLNGYWNEVIREYHRQRTAT